MNKEKILKKSIYALLLVNQQATVFIQTDKGWQIHPIYGEQSNPISNNDTAPIKKIISEIDKYINLEEQLANVEVILICDEYCIKQVSSELPEYLNQLKCSTFRFVSWENAKEEAMQLGESEGQVAEDNDNWLYDIFLPLLDAGIDSKQAIIKQKEINKQYEETLAQLRAEHEETLAQLHTEKDDLREQINDLQEQINRLSVPDLEKLTTYLPIIYRNFWNSIKPSDLALIAGTYRIPEVPSPFPEPSRDTVALMKKRLQSLPRSEYEKIIHLCRELPHQLEIRPEMRFIIDGDKS